MAASLLCSSIPARSTVIQSQSAGAVDQSKDAYATFYWTLSTAGGVQGSGLLTTGGVDGQGVDILTFSGNIAGNAVALIGGAHSTYATSPTGAYYFDNRLFATSDPVLDLGGILFNIAGHEANIWGTGPQKYSYWTWINGYYDYSDDNSFFTVTRASEPAAAIPFLTAVLVTMLLRTPAVRAGAARLLRRT